MRLSPSLASCLAALFVIPCAADSNVTQSQVSDQSLPAGFVPPQVFKNVNLVRTINLDKGYPRETVNVVIENIDSQPQEEYYLPVDLSVAPYVSAIDVRDKKDASKGAFQVAALDTDSATSFFRVTLPEALKPSEQFTLSISFSTLSQLIPLPAQITQMEKQYLQYTFNTYAPSAYTTSKQKTKVKFPTPEIPDYTKSTEANSENSEDPQKQGSVLTWGPYGEVAAGSVSHASARYEFTKPINHVSLLERDIEVSHWGGNLAVEERYWLTNRGASLKGYFNRRDWQATQHYKPPTSALRELTVPLSVGSSNAYFIDDIGNVSTSRFRSNLREATLELKPRYPIFGDWKYKFKIGWDQSLKSSLRKLTSGDGYILKVPFLEGPKQAEGVEYAHVKLQVILPEGATNVKFETAVPILSSDISIYRTFMDTEGRTTLILTASNLVDDMKDLDLIISYDYPHLAIFRKPVVMVAALFGTLATIYLVGRLDVSIGRKTE